MMMSDAESTATKPKTGGNDSSHSLLVKRVPQEKWAGGVLRIEKIGWVCCGEFIIVVVGF